MVVWEETLCISIWRVGGIKGFSLLENPKNGFSALGTASVLPLACAVATLSSSSHTVKSSPILAFPSSTSMVKTRHLGALLTFASAQPALHMDSSSERKQPGQVEERDEVLPELLTEFMVDMKCDGCVSAVKNKLHTLDGVSRIDVDLSNQVVRVLGSVSVMTMISALEQTGRKARLIGQGSPDDFIVSAAVAEFKGPIVLGVVRFAQVNMELAKIEATFSGLPPGIHGWSINEFGDLTKGAASTGTAFNLTNGISSIEPLGDLGTLNASEIGEAYFAGVKKMLRVSDLVGRSVVVYESEDKSDTGIAAAVIARSAGVGENYKKICLCDGTIIWESSRNDFADS